MRYLFCGINAKYIHTNLAILSLQAYGKKNADAEILVREYTINHYVDDILQDLYEADADVIIFSAYIWNIDYVTELAAEYKKVAPGCSLWAGGPEVSYDSRRFLLDHPAVDLVMRGEGEEVFRQLICHYDGSLESVPDLPGIAIRRGPGQVEDYGFAPLMDMDDIPFVYDDFTSYEHKILYYETSRGCPFRCSYCLSSIDKSVRFRSMGRVKEELDAFLNARVAQVKFVDRTFNCNIARAKEIWTYLTLHDNGVTNFHFEISADLLDDDCITLFREMRPGLIQLEIGVQSTNPPTLEAIRRQVDLDRLFRRVDQVHDLGNIHQHLDLIAGLPYEDYERFSHSFDDVYAHNPDQLQLGFLKVLTGTRMMEESE
ncbi:MAG: B12-binding domain-containing radical SAM protein, partial [Eubacterium sp.]|nr:B12-binding domain-containing radical SAM protein [Eubacterium sp.]